MATKVLRPRDLLVDRCNRQPRSFHRRRDVPASSVANRSQDRKAFTPVPNNRKSIHDGDSDTPPKFDVTSSGLITGQVRLLKRGESLSLVKTAAVTLAAPLKPVEGLTSSHAQRIDSDLSEMVPKQIRWISAPPLDPFAGSVCYSSPSPRALPVPSFLKSRSPKNLR